MNSALLLSATFLMGVEYRVEQFEGESVYVIEVEEAIVDQLTDGFEINSLVPAEQTRIDRIRVRIVQSSPDVDSIIPDDGNDSLPDLSPDISILPPQSETLVSSEIELEPKAISLPKLDKNEPSVEDDMATSLVPQFDSLTSEGTLSDEDSITLLVPTDSSVILQEDSTPVLSIDAEPISNPLNSPISETPTIPEQGTTGQDILAEPNLIQDNADTFIALASHQSDRLPPPEREKNKTEAANRNTTPLLLLLFSVTLNLFFGFQVFRQYRN